MTTEWKPDPVSASSLIQVGKDNSNYRSLANITSMDQLLSIEASAPSFHTSAMRALETAAKMRQRNSNDEETQQIVSRHHIQREPKAEFGRGAKVVNKEGKRLTIIYANAGVTRKSKTPVHKVADRKGNTWLEKQSNLTLEL